jgi:hypothetical protein
MWRLPIEVKLRGAPAPPAPPVAIPHDRPSTAIEFLSDMTHNPKQALVFIMIAGSILIISAACIVGGCIAVAMASKGIKDVPIGYAVPAGWGGVSFLIFITAWIRKLRKADRDAEASVQKRDTKKLQAWIYRRFRQRYRIPPWLPTTARCGRIRKPRGSRRLRSSRRYPRRPLNRRAMGAASACPRMRRVRRKAGALLQSRTSNCDARRHLLQARVSTRLPSAVPSACCGSLAAQHAAKRLRRITISMKLPQSCDLRPIRCCLLDLAKGSRCRYSSYEGLPRRTRRAQENPGCRGVSHYRTIA